MTDENRAKIREALWIIINQQTKPIIPWTHEAAADEFAKMLGNDKIEGRRSLALLDAEDDRGTRPAPSSEKALRAALEKARLIIAIYTFTHAKWFYRGIEQDPSGSHALLAEIDALLAGEAPKEEA